MTDRVEVSDHDRQLWACAPIASSMPVSFPGDVQWLGVDGNCAGCDRVIEQGMFRGTVTRPFPNVAVVDAVGMCEACQLMTRFHYRLHDDMRVTGISGENWGEWRPMPTAMDRLRSLVGRAFRTLAGIRREP